MKAPRLPDVTARVVAWHNRHPLARRIDPTQVHSIGEVRLPFASATPYGAAGDLAGPRPQPAAMADTLVEPPAITAKPAGPSLAEALAQRTAHQQQVAADDANSPDQPDLQPELGAVANGTTAAADDTQMANGQPAGLASGPAPDAAADLAADMGPAVDLTPAANDDIDLALDAPAPDAGEDDSDEAALVIPLLDGEHALDDAEVAPALAPDSLPADGAQAPPDAATTPDDPPPDTLDAPDLAPQPTATTAPPDGAAPDLPTFSPAGGQTGVDAPSVDGVRPGTPSGPDTDVESVTVYPAPHGNVPTSALARAVERRAAARGGDAGLHGTQDTQDPHDPHPSAVPQPAPATLPNAAPPTPGSRWRRLLQAVRTAITGRQPGMPLLRAAFSQDFIWPLRPGQVARWAQRHGQAWPIAPAGWPQRSVDTDHARLATLRQKGLFHTVPLHVLSAAIGVGDRRMRVLLGADGSIIGPRAYSRARVGSAAMLLAVGLVGAGWALRPLHGAGAGDGDGALALATLPTAPASAASATALGSAASAPASEASGTSAATALADAASATNTHGPGSTDSADAPADATDHAVAPADAASQPQADIRPSLSSDDKYAARAQAAKLRGEPPPPEPPQSLVYAVVSPASDQRATAATSLALMQSAAARLDGAAPEHGELVQSQGQWRAAWWPFTTLVDAERARVLLAGRGLKAEVIEF